MKPIQLLIKLSKDSEFLCAENKDEGISVLICKDGLKALFGQDVLAGNCLIVSEDPMHVQGEVKVWNPDMGGPWIPKFNIKGEHYHATNSIFDTWQRLCPETKWLWISLAAN